MSKLLFKLNDIQTILNSISLNGFPYDIKIEVRNDMYDYIFFVGNLWTIDRDKQEKMVLVSTCSSKIYSKYGIEETEVLEIAVKLMERIICHELREFFVVNGTRCF